MTLRIIGDVHGQVNFALKAGARTYLQLVDGCASSVQVGDMGDAETYGELDEFVDAKQHRFFGGNHDHYDDLPKHCLGDYGSQRLGGINFFFIRGVCSSDKKKLLERGQKLGKKLWYEEEEIPESQHARIIEAYIEAKPKLVLSHTCPTSIVPFIYDFVRSRSRYPVTSRAEASRTNRLLEELLAAHRPVTWIFGHYHHDWSYAEDGTTFRCVGELSYFDLEPSRYI